MRLAEADCGTALDPARQEKARAYARSARLLYFIDIGIGAAFLGGLFFGGVARRAAALLPLPVPLSVVVLFAGLAMAYSVVSLPTAYYRGFVLPHRYGLGTQRVPAWLIERAKRAALVVVMGMAVAAFAYWTMEAVPGIWWLLTGGLVLSVTVVLNLLAPVAIMPLFYRCTPVRDEEISQRLTGLARRADTTILGVFTIDQSRRSTTANAMLMGLGKTRRIVVSDGLSHSYTHDEIEAIMAHELGHHLHHDIPRLMALQSVLGLAGFFLCYLVVRLAAAPLGLHGLSDPAGLPLVIMVLGAFSLVMGPFTSAYIRDLERKADRRALELTGKPDAFVSLMTKLANQNLNEADPGKAAEFLFYDHPPYRERIRMAREYARQAPC